MTKQIIPIVGQSYEMPSLQLDAQNCINWYLTQDSTGKFQTALFPTDGLTMFLEISGQNNIRGLLELNNNLYVVAGNGFYTVDTAGNYIHRGTLGNSSGNIKMVPNITQIFMTDGKLAYIYQYKATDTHSLHEFFEVKETTANIDTPTFTGSGLDDMSTSGTYKDVTLRDFRVEIYTKGNPDTFRWSGNGGETWDATGVPITGLTQVLNPDYGVEVQFQHLTGHTVRDRWDFQASPDSTFYVPVIPAYQDGYGIYIRQNTDRFHISAIDDFSTVNSLDFAEEKIWPDHLQGAISIREELWLIGRTITRVWYNTGAELFPFEPRTNLSIKYGTLAPYSIAVGHDNILFWLGNNDEGGAVAIMVANYSPKIISTEPVNEEWLTYERVDDAIGFVIQKGGHIFYHLIFPTADRTWVYDLTTSTWHEKRSTYTNIQPNTSDERQGRWRGNNYTYFANKHLVGDWSTSKIFKLDSKNYTDDGAKVIRERTTRHIQDNLQRMLFDSLQIDMQAGSGLTDSSDQGYEPKIMLQISKDQGMTFGNELWRTSGKIGQYNTRVKWNRLGSGRSFTFRIKTSDPVYNVVLGAVAEVEVSQT